MENMKIEKLQEVKSFQGKKVVFVKSNIPFLARLEGEELLVTERLLKFFSEEQQENILAHEMNENHRNIFEADVETVKEYGSAGAYSNLLRGIVNTIGRFKKGKIDQQKFLSKVCVLNSRMNALHSHL